MNNKIVTVVMLALLCYSNIVVPMAKKKTGKIPYGTAVQNDFLAFKKKAEQFKTDVNQFKHNVEQFKKVSETESYISYFWRIFSHQFLRQQTTYTVMVKDLESLQHRADYLREMCGELWHQIDDVEQNYPAMLGDLTIVADRVYIRGFLSDLDDFDSFAYTI